MTRKTPASAAFAGHIVRIAEYLAYSEYRLDELAPTNANLRGEYPNHHLARTAFARKHPRLERLECAMAIEKAFVDTHDDVVKAAGENRYALANLDWGWAEMR